MPRLLLATGNAGKVREIREMTAAAGVDWVGLDAFPDVPEAIEDGATFAENARIKALHYAGATGLLTLADDSGLCVDALDGAPGVHSARFAGEPRDDARNNAKLVRDLTDIPDQQRTARFRCCLAFAEPGRVLLEAEGAVEGRIVDEPGGTNGFGYDPHFFVASHGRRMAELPPDEKNAISHRGAALRALWPKLEALLRARGLLG